MGQCYGRLRSTMRRQATRRQYRHKRFDYSPKRSWKYKDAHVLNQISLRGAEYDSPVWELEEGGGGRARGRGGGGRGGGRGGGGRGGGREETVLMNPLAAIDSEEEDVGEVRSGGRLVFVEAEEMEDDRIQSPRDRSSSNSSYQIGRFDVYDVENDYEHTGSDVGVVRGEEGEGEEGEGEMVEVDLSNTDTALLLVDDVT